MHHAYYVGFFDPADPFDDNQRPYPPKPQRPLPREAFVAAVTPALEHYVFWNDAGYVDCPWSRAPRQLWEEVIRFAFRLAEENGAVVLNELFITEYPPEAKRIGDSWFYANSRNLNVSGRNA